MPPKERERTDSSLPDAERPPNPVQAEQMHSDLRRLTEAAKAPQSVRRTIEAARQDIKRISADLGAIGLDKTPMLGPRYKAELDRTRGLLAAASEALERNDIEASLKLFGQARERIGRLAGVFQAETALIEGMPAGLPRRISLNKLLDSMEATLQDEGPLRARARTVLEAAGIYAANSDKYNTDNPTVRAERDALFDFMIERGAASRTVAPYTEGKSDADTLSSFRSNAQIISGAVREREIALVGSWREEISRQLLLVRSPAVAEMLRGFDRELETSAKDLRAGRDMHGDEFALLAQRFYTLSGTVPPITESMKLGAIREGANALAPDARYARDFSPAWYGRKALESLDGGDAGMASLSLSMGMLERAAGGRLGGRGYLPQPDYTEIHDAIAKNRVLGRPQMSHYLSEVRSATILAECDRMENEAPLVGTHGRREMAGLIREAASGIRAKASAGDTDGAQRLFEMTDGYERLVKSNGWKPWSGSAEMESALRLELGGHSGKAAFEAGLAYQSFSAETSEFRRTLGRWGPGLQPEKDLLIDALSKADELAREGRFAEARRIMTCSVMYADGVARISTGRKGRPEALDPHVTPGVLDRMEAALAALASGKDLVEGRSAEDAFMKGYSECIQTYITLRACALGSLERSRPIGKDILDGALEEARARSKKGDFRGAITLLAYVEDFYGSPSSKRGEGWRYKLFDTPSSRDAEGISRGRDGLLEAIQAERRATTQGDHVSAARLFESSLTLITSTESLARESATLRRRYMGQIPLVPGNKSTLGQIPFGARGKDGAYPYYMPLEQVRGYEAGHKDDPALGKGPSLERLLSDCRSAARSGDVEEYNTAVRAFNMRFELVTGRVGNYETYSKAIRQVDQVMTGLVEMKKVYGGGPGRIGELEALSQKAGKMRELLVKGRAGYKPFPSEGFASLISDVASERRLAMGVSLLNQQITLGDAYLYDIKGERGDMRDRAVERLTISREHLLKARDALVAGNTQDASTEYNIAIESRIDALVAYRSDNAVNFMDVMTAHRRHPNAMGIDERFAPEFRIRRQYEEFSEYLSAHRDSFNAVISGNPSAKSLSDITSRGNGTTLIESSIFAVPADATSQFLDSFASEQQEIRFLVANGDNAGAQRILVAMRERAERNRWAANVALIGVGLMSAFIPVAGPWISGAIFTGIAVDRIETEYRRDGHASGEAWLMLGLTVGTMGFGGAAAGTARLAATAEEVTSATRLMTLSRAFTYTNLGVGSFMVGYMGGSTWNLYQDYREGKARSRDVILSGGMTLFPVVHMTVSGVSSYRARISAARAGQTLPIDPTLGPDSGPGGGMKTTEVPLPDLTSPDGVFSFMQRLTGPDAGAKAVAQEQLARLPSPVRSAIEGWIGKPGAVSKALEAGSLNDMALARINTGIDGFRPNLEGPQDTGTLAQNDVLRLSNETELGKFLRALLSPANGKPGQVTHDAETATLARIRLQNPEAARFIDRLISGEDYGALRQELASGKPLSSKSAMTLRNNSVQLGDTLPETMRPKAMAASGNEPPKSVEGRVEPHGEGRETTRASAEGEGKGGTPKPAPRQGTGVSTEESVPESRKGGKPAEKDKHPSTEHAEDLVQLTPTEMEQFVESPKRIIRSLGLASDVEARALKNIDDTAWLRKSNADQVKMNMNRGPMLAKMEQSFRATAKELGWSQDAIEAYSERFISLLDVSERSGYTTYGHTMRVAEYTEMILRDMNLPPEEKAKIMMAALIHDLGKIGVSNDIWRLTGKPSEENRLMIETHAGLSKTIADKLLETIGLVDPVRFRDISTMAQYHQEFFDGTKYFGKKGDEIPLGSRIIVIADSYDAMVAKRAYNRGGMSPIDAIKDIEEKSGTQFDPVPAKIFVDHIRKSVGAGK